MKLLTLIISFVIVTPIMAADKPSGCLIKIKNRVVTDPACKCLEKKVCAQAKVFTYSKKFFDTKDGNGKAVFSEKEKKAYQESYKLLNKIMALKASGKGKSAEINLHYIQLEKINAEIDELLKKNHPKLINAMNARQAQQSKKRQIRNAKRDKMISDYLENPEKVQVARESAPSSVQESTAKTPPAQPSQFKPAPVVVSQKSDELSNDDKEIILKNLKNKEYEVKEEDSIFDIISKTYKSRAYKRLLVPSESQEKE